jgi:hypothetical protein
MSGHKGMNTRGTMGGNRSRPDKPTGKRPSRCQLYNGQMVRIVSPDGALMQGTLATKRGNSGFVLMLEGAVMADVTVMSEQVEVE